MHFDEATLFAFLLVFVRCSAMLLASPIFGGRSVPLQVRIFTTLAVAGAITAVIKPHLAPLPASLLGLAGAVAGEALAGVLIGALMSLVLQMAEMAGSILDIQVGLSMSQTLNPVTGVSVSILAQFKFMLATVVFLSANAHHLMLQALVQSYAAPGLAATTFPKLESGVVDLLATMSLVALQIAAPVLAVSLVVDAALGLVNRAVPQMMAMQVGTPARLGAGILALSLSLPPLVAGVTYGCGLAFNTVQHLFAK